MARKNKITTETTLHLSYPLAKYPGWRPGETIASHLIGPDGTVYEFTGLAVAIRRITGRSRIDIFIVHNPTIDQGTPGALIE